MIIQFLQLTTYFGGDQRDFNYLTKAVLIASNFAVS